MTPASKRIAAGAGTLVLASASLVGYLRLWEGDVHTVYADRLAYGIPTVCAGHTDWSMKPGQVYTKADCDRIDAKTALEYGSAVVACLGAQHLNQNRLDAFTLFAVNVGKAGACNSRAAQLMRAGQYTAACKAISHGPSGQRVWSYSGGKFRRGLANRRDFERELCLKPISQERAAS